jgi:hypothetical protein
VAESQGQRILVKQHVVEVGSDLHAICNETLFPNSTESPLITSSSAHFFPHLILASQYGCLLLHWFSSMEVEKSFHPKKLEFLSEASFPNLSNSIPAAMPIFWQTSPVRRCFSQTILLCRLNLSQAMRFIKFADSLFSVARFQIDFRKFLAIA